MDGNLWLKGKSEKFHVYTLLSLCIAERLIQLCKWKAGSLANLDHNSGHKIIHSSLLPTTIQRRNPTAAKEMDLLRKVVIIQKTNVSLSRMRHLLALLFLRQHSYFLRWEFRFWFKTITVIHIRCFIASLMLCGSRDWEFMSLRHRLNDCK